MTTKPHRHRRQIFLAVALALLGAGCSTSTYEVKVDAISKPDATGAAGSASGPQSFRIKSKNPALGEENLRYREAADYVKTALSGKGLFEAPTEEKADMIVELEYGLAAPRTKLETASTPVYAQKGGGVRYEQVMTTDAKGNNSGFRTVAVYEPPSTELVGYDDLPRQVTIYEKYLHITARINQPASEGRPPAEIWSVNATTEDESKDLRKYLPIMASATVDFIGKDSAHEKTVRIKDPSQLTDFIKKGMAEPVPVAARPKSSAEKI